jgi:serine/threonine protein kinase
MAEIKLLSAMRHRNIIRLLEVFETEHQLFMVMEYANGGDLLNFMKQNKNLDEGTARDIFK